MDDDRQLVGASGGRRWLAAVVDLVAMFIVARLAAEALSSIDELFAGLMMFVVCLAYYLLFEWWLAATPGKFVTGLRVVDASGEPAGIFAVSVRTLLRVVEVNPLLFGAAPAALFVLFTKRRQRLGDLLGGAYVVAVEDLSAFAANEANVEGVSCPSCGEALDADLQSDCPICGAVVVSAYHVEESR